ncbi:PAAR domain-containing protein [Paraburkholderia sp. J67]|uniref:PAAR domain-containing protein n=1 Tax=Paraburkholderia sp. J67 TaxID=2805435 RepID=UPI002ABD4963|nr:PAAR domain-containing protein [Paraburkholderia sp. J67]
MADQQKRKCKMYAFATIGARTARGECVTTGSRSAYCGLAIARVGDVVTYRDGSETVIMDGAWFAMTINNRPVALVGSSLSNGDSIILDSGDTINDSPHRDVTTARGLVPVDQHGNVLSRR